MRQSGPGGRRPRGRHHNGGQNGNTGVPPVSGGRPRSAASLRHQTFDSNGPDVRVRGNAWQVCEKYQALARDAASAGDRVLAENYLQHAEHYFRIVEAINDAAAAEQRQRAPSSGPQPEVPPNYFTPEGVLAAPQTSASDVPASSPVSPPASSGKRGPAVKASAPSSDEAEVQRVSPPPSFFTQEELEEQSSSGQETTLLAQNS